MNLKSVPLSFLCTAVVSWACPHLLGETRIVDKANGPYYTIQSAVDAAADGDTVFVRNGVHDQGGALDGFSSAMSNRVYLTKSLMLVGESKEGAIIRGAHATEALMRTASVAARTPFASSASMRTMSSSRT